MVIALVALALVMLVGGVASVVQGFPYVRLESGLAMVIGGASAASAGAVLLGLAAAVERLRRIELAVQAGGWALRPGEPSLNIAPLPPATAPALAGAAGLAGLTVGAAGLTASRQADAVESAAPVPDVRPEDRLAEAPPPAEPGPDLPQEPASSGTDAAVPDDDLFAVSAGEAPVEIPLHASPVAAPETAPADMGADEPEAEELQVVGTYASGGNTYVMYSNGSIEAETPRGRFTFDSLDELKQFVEAGGETNTRGAA